MEALLDWQDLVSRANLLLVARSAIVVSVAFAAGWLLARLAIGGARRWAKKSQGALDDAIVQHLRRPVSWLLPVALTTLSLPLAAPEAGGLSTLRQALVVGLTLNVGWVFFNGVRVAEDVINARFQIDISDNLQARAVRTQMQGFRNIAGFLIGVATIGVALLTFSSVRQVGAGLLASAGVAGIMIGFAAQRSISTIVAGLQIAISQPIRVDDVVIVEGEWGRIEEITLTYVVVRIWDLRRLVVPVNYFIEKPFQNWTRTSSELLGTVSLPLDYSVDIDELRAELQRIVENSPHWDGKVCGIQVVDSTERCMIARPLVSAADASAAWDLRCEVREKLIRFVRDRYPEGLPRLRAEVSS